MDIFYGAAIQGVERRGERADIHRALIQHIRQAGFRVVSEHTTGSTREETAALMEEALGPLPPPGLERSRYVRRRMLELVEGPIVAAVFECSVPSLGTGVELAHAYLRPRTGRTAIPILVLYEREFWKNGLSAMVRGIVDLPWVRICEYGNVDHACRFLDSFLQELRGPE